MSLTDQIAPLLDEAEQTQQNSRVVRHGVALARVTNCIKQDTIYRVKCLIVGADDDEETDWCDIICPFGGMSYGAFWRPRIDDLVVLAYWDGDPHRPVVMGSLWTPEVKPPEFVIEGKTQDYAICTPSKIELCMHDEPEKHQFTCKLPSGAMITMDDSAKQIQMQDKDGENVMRLNWQNGEITLKASKKLTFQTGDTTMTMENNGNVTVSGKGTLSFDGTNVQVKAKSQFEAQGGTVGIKSNATMDWKASGIMTAQAKLVKIN